MAVFKVDIEKSDGPDGALRWTNAYHVQTTDFPEARLAAAQIVSMEEGIHSTAVYFQQVRISTIVEDDEVFVTLPINEAGVYAVNGDGMPKFLALRVDLSPDISFKGRKFYHLLLGEASQAGGVWAAQVVTDVNTFFETLIFDMSEEARYLCNPTGTSLYMAASAQSLVTMHQFRRGSKRPVPILT